jgi:hypothetical protein
VHPLDHYIILCNVFTHLHIILSPESNDPEVKYEPDVDAAEEEVGAEGQEVAPEDTANLDPSSLSSVDQGKPRCIYSFKLGLLLYALIYVHISLCIYVV